MDSNGAVTPVSMEELARQIKAYLNASWVHKFKIDPGVKMAFVLRNFAHYSFTASSSGGSAQASGFITGYNQDVIRWFLNGKTKDSSNLLVNAYMSKTKENIFVIENGYTSALEVIFMSSEPSIPSAVYDETLHGELVKMTWGGGKRLAFKRLQNAWFGCGIGRAERRVAA